LRGGWMQHRALVVHPNIGARTTHGGALRITVKRRPRLGESRPLFVKPDTE
jgi:hypothetical protein